MLVPRVHANRPHLIFPTGEFWVDPNEGITEDAIKVYCDFSFNATCLYSSKEKKVNRSYSCVELSLASYVSPVPRARTNKEERRARKDGKARKPVSFHVCSSHQTPLTLRVVPSALVIKEAVEAECRNPRRETKPEGTSYNERLSLIYNICFVFCLCSHL